MYDILQLNEMIMPDLQEIASKLKLKKTSKLEKHELVLAIIEEQARQGGLNAEADDKPKRKRLVGEKKSASA